MIWFQRKAKFNNQKTEYNGRVYDSKGEKELAVELDLKLKAGELLKVEPQVVFNLYGKNGTVVCIHKPDFLLTFKDGHQEVAEYKGFQTDTWRLKLKLFQDNYPQIPYYVITVNERYYYELKRRRNRTQKRI